MQPVVERPWLLAFRLMHVLLQLRPAAVLLQPSHHQWQCQVRSAPGAQQQQQHSAKAQQVCLTSLH